MKAVKNGKIQTISNMEEFFLSRGRKGIKRPAEKQTLYVMFEMAIENTSRREAYATIRAIKDILDTTASFVDSRIKYGKLTIKKERENGKA